MRGGGVAELDVAARVGRRERDLGTAVPGSPGARAIVSDALDGPGVAVLDPRSAGAEPAVVLASDDAVSHAGDRAPRDLHAALLHFGGGDAIGAGAEVEFGCRF